MKNVTIRISKEQLDVICGSLQTSINNAHRKGFEALAKGFADAQQEKDFYDKVESSCSAVLLRLESVKVPKDDEEDDDDRCSECGEDYGFCQCDEEEEEDDE